MRIIDRFTTRDGEWEQSNKPFSITPIAISRYGAIAPHSKGASTHIFVMAPAGSVVDFHTNDGQNLQSMLVPSDGWVEFPMFHSSSYDPGKGERGPWAVRVDGQVIADGIGLPYSWHVSTWLIVGEGNTGTGPSVPAVEKEKVQLIVNGVVVWEN